MWFVNCDYVGIQPLPVAENGSDQKKGDFKSKKFLNINISEYKDVSGENFNWWGFMFVNLQ